MAVLEMSFIVLTVFILYSQQFLTVEAMYIMLLLICKDICKNITVWSYFTVNLVAVMLSKCKKGQTAFGEIGEKLIFFNVWHNIRRFFLIIFISRC